MAAVKAALAPVLRHERQLVGGKLEETVYQFFCNGKMGLQFEATGWQELIHEYCDSVLTAVMQRLSARPWLNQVDFVLVVDAGIKFTFPREVYAEVPEEDFQKAVLQAHDRAYEEHRYAVILWDVVNEHVPDAAQKKKVAEAFEQGRRDAVRELLDAFQAGTSEALNLEDFVSGWVRNCLTNYSVLNGGVLDATLDKSATMRIFQILIEVGTLPIPLIAKEGPPPRNWRHLEAVVQATATDLGAEGKGWKGGGDSWKNKRKWNETD